MDFMKKDTEEEWRYVTFPPVILNTYKISSYGNIMNAITGRILVQYQHPRTKYFTIKLKYVSPIDGRIKYKNFYIHKLVGWEFCELKPNRHVCNHINGNKEDNYYKNLEWVTSGENTRHALMTGLTKIYGSDNHTNIYNEEFVRKICSYLEKGIPKSKILKIITNDEKATCRKYSKLYALIVHLHYKDRFTNICNEYNYKPLSFINMNDPITKMLLNGYENIDIMRAYGYNRIDDNTALYSKILLTRKILFNVQRLGYYK